MELNRIIQGDNIALCKTLPADFIDLTVTSPPYDHLREYSKSISTSDDFDGYSFPFEPLARELYRITKPGGVVVWVVGDGTTKEGSETGTSFRQALYFKECGFLLYDTMIYQKSGPPHPDMVRYQQVFEYMFVLSKGRPKTVNLLQDRKNTWGGKFNFGKVTTRMPNGTMKQTSADKVKIREYGYRFNVWVLQPGYGFGGDKIAHEHPAVFPEAIPDGHIKTWTNEGDLVLDPFMGSGTTGKMAKLNKRNYLGFEMVEEYVRLGEKRIGEFDNNLLSFMT